MTDEEREATSPSPEVSPDPSLASASQAAPSASLVQRGGLAKGISAGLSGEEVSGQGILDAIGGARGITEALLPGLLYLVMFIITQDARLSVIAPAAIAVAAFVWRLAQRQTLVTSLSGLLGVGICVATTLMSGKGEDFFLPGFWINTAWSVALVISLVVGWPILGFIVGALQGDITGWRRVPKIRRTATVASLLWLTMFLLRLAVQLPLYFAENVAALGVARLVMGTPLFALVILATWLMFRNMPSPERTSEK
ncbi:DUF3159 domain-containing protein [Leucobacter chinensis]|uniref:DUF3159 domain-containing protein n=1 Tax=Leucobacter chinensis TaxID=2851010 RepID=UPI001C241F34